MPLLPSAARPAGAAASLLALSALGSCCWDPCVAPTSTATVSFVFSADTLAGGSGFCQAEVRSAYVVEYADDRLTRPRDTLRIGKRLVLFDRRRIQLYFAGDSAYFAPVASYYRIVVPAAGRQYAIRHVSLDVAYSNECHTTCVNVRGIRFTLNGQPVAFDQPNPAPAAAVPLRR